ncbi:MAG TPA: branched-chain amino acid ABC transporter permease [Bacilli bacterium]|nr:branched-chain amino acid ABC transporter permease [Bacilli bacterium]
MRERLFNNKLLLVILLAALAILPFVTDSKFLLSMMITVFIMAVYGMSYDLLLGYTGIVSFGHAIFFGVGAYSVGILLAKTGDKGLLWLAVGLAIVLSIVLGILVGVLSLRVKDVYFSMVTLAVGELLFIIAEKWNTLTGGNDGLTYIPVPKIFHDRLAFYYIALLFLAVMYLFLRRVVSSPLGRTLQAIRENEHRVRSLGYNVLQYKVASIVISGVVATLAGAMWALFQRYINTSVLGLDRTIDALLMTIIGGSGTLIGAVFGSGVITFVHDWLSSLSGVSPIFERYMMFFGIIYIIIVIWFPKGIIGTIRDKWMSLRHSRRS